MPGDLNRTFLLGSVVSGPFTAGKGWRLTLRTTDEWVGKEGPRVKSIDHEILVLHPSLVEYARHFRVGDRVLVEGTHEREGTIVLGGLHASLQLVKKSSEIPAGET